jgi:hypothetical protein
LELPLADQRDVASPSLASGAVLLPEDDAIARYTAMSHRPKVAGRPTRSAKLLPSKRDGSSRAKPKTAAARSTSGTDGETHSG